jgi:hypothetical protein
MKVEKDMFVCQKVLLAKIYKPFYTNLKKKKTKKNLVLFGEFDAIDS